MLLFMSCIFYIQIFAVLSLFRGTVLFYSFDEDDDGMQWKWIVFDRLLAAGRCFECKDNVLLLC